MLDNHRNHFPIDFTQNAPGFLRIPLVNHTMLFPQLKQQFNLPAKTHNDHNFMERAVCVAQL
ncbi:hypothetical protein ccbrp13_24610 [Ktedonobacteria bacterium brp13]|nr:hypothetical protein ccbrp13_24610 [Ktedonobacteria bacterium brp13]